MAKATITRLFKGMKETKYGSKPSVSLKCVEYGDKWISTFKVTPQIDEWKEGDVVEINVTENKGYLNFDTGTPSATAGLEARVRAIEQMIGITTDEKVVQVDEVKSTSEKYDFDF